MRVKDLPHLILVMDARARLDKFHVSLMCLRAIILSLCSSQVCVSYLTCISVMQFDAPFLVDNAPPPDLPSIVKVDIYSLFFGK